MDNNKQSPIKQPTIMSEKDLPIVLVNIDYSIIESPIGKLLLINTNKKLTKVAFENENHGDIIAKLKDKFDSNVVQNDLALEKVTTQLSEYFTRQRKSFDLPLDLSLINGSYHKQVVQHLVKIPYGKVRSYAQLAKHTGNEKAIRAAASACANNPLPIILPCHRVVRTNGDLGKYRGGIKAKQYLINLENNAEV